MNAVPEIVECLTIGPATVRLRFRDGLVKAINLAPALHGPIFRALRQPEKFREVTIKNGTLVWPNGADICPTVLHYWCELGWVISQEELDAHFAPRELATPGGQKVAETSTKDRTQRKK